MFVVPMSFILTLLPEFRKCFVRENSLYKGVLLIIFSEKNFKNTNKWGLLCIVVTSTFAVVFERLSSDGYKTLSVHYVFHLFFITKL